MKDSIEGIEDLLESDSFVEWASGKSARDTIYWEQWSKSNPEKQAMMDQAKEIVKGLTFEVRQIDSDRVEHALAQLSHGVLEVEERKILRNKRNMKRRLWAMAATFLLLAAGGTWYWYHQFYEKIRHQTAYGEWKEITLPDGSLVKLNANSELTYARDWDEAESREVWLKGEAFFEVVKMMELDREFKVFTTDLDVEVLGTSFNVKARGEQTEVYLEEGKVKLNLGDQFTYLDPGDIISYSARKHKVVDRRRQDPSTKSVSTWNDGVIQMENEYAFQIFNKIEEIYGVEIRVSNEQIYNEQYYVGVPMKELEIVIPILEKSMRVNITRKGQILIIE